jgi:hypothetical protein
MSDQKTAPQNKGYLFPNANKQGQQPDFRGKLNIDGKEWLVSGWNKGDEGMISLSLTDPASLPPRQGGGGQASSGRSGSSPAPAPASHGATGMGDIWDDLPG